MRAFNLFKLCPAVFCAAALASTPLSAGAADPVSGDDWKFNASIYFWAPGLKGETASGNNFDIDFDTLLDNLDKAFMGAFEVRKSGWSLLTDVIYLELGANEAANVAVPIAGPLSINVNVKADVDLKAYVVNFVGGYNVWQTPQWTLDVLAGARYFDLELDLDLGVNAAKATAATDISPSVDVLDGVIGVKGHVDVDKQWYLPYYFDIGAGQSKFTWQALVGVGTRFGWGDVSLTYRHIGWKFDSNARVDDAYLSGPMLAATFNF